MTDNPNPAPGRRLGLIAAFQDRRDTSERWLLHHIEGPSRRPTVDVGGILYVSPRASAQIIHSALKSSGGDALPFFKARDAVSSTIQEFWKDKAHVFMGGTPRTRRSTWGYEYGC